MKVYLHEESKCTYHSTCMVSMVEIGIVRKCGSGIKTNPPTSEELKEKKGKRVENEISKQVYLFDSLQN